MDDLNTSAPPERPSDRHSEGVPQNRTTGAIRGALIGTVLGVDAVGHCIALATLCFAGGLIGGLGLATALFLLSTAAMALVLVFRSALPNAIGISQDTSIAILAPAVALAAAAAAAAGGDEGARIATALAVIGSAAVLTGIALLAVGGLGLGNLVRLMPYPVGAGFLASSGWLLVLSAILILSGVETVRDIPARLEDADFWALLLPAAGLAAMLMVTIRHRQGVFLLVAMVLLAIAAFYVALGVTGLGLEGARAKGYLPPEASALMPDGYSALGLYRQVDWTAVLQTAPVLAIVVLINLMGVLLNITGIELVARRDVDVNRELRLTGWTNLAIGSVGGLAGYITSGSTAVANKTAPAGRAVGISFSVVILIGCALAGPMVSFVPVFVAAGLLVFIGASMLEDWLVKSYFRLVHTDWLIILGIVIVTIFFGILQAILAGLALAVLAFVIGYARLPVIRQTTDACNRRSTLQRPPEEDRILTRYGNRIRILQLQGYLFFGSLDRVLRRLKTEIASVHPNHGTRGMIILDLLSVTGLDSAGCAALGKLGEQAKARGVDIHLAAMPDEMRDTTQRWGVDLSGQAGLYAWPSVDAALEACETALIKSALVPQPQLSISGRLQLLGQGHPRIAELLGMMDRISLDKGSLLIRAETQSGDVYFLETGRLSVQIPTLSGAAKRLSSLAPGAVVGEVARYRDRQRTADVVAEEPSIVYCLTHEIFLRLEQDDRDLAALVHAILATALAEKVVRTSRSFAIT